MRILIDTEKLNYDAFPTETGEPGDEFITRKKLESLSTIHTLFLCDGKKCNNCSYPTCKHTRDLNHAQNFEHYTEYDMDIHIEKGKPKRLQDWQFAVKKDPYESAAAEAYVTAINILAVEYLIKTHNEAEYGWWCSKVNSLSETELESLQIHLSLNMHASSLGAMITQGDYEHQKEVLFDFLKGEIS